MLFGQYWSLRSADKGVSRGVAAGENARQHAPHRARRRGAGAIRRGHGEVLAAGDALVGVGALQARRGKAVAVLVLRPGDEHARVAEVAVDGRRRRVAALGVHLETAEEAPDAPVRTSHNRVHHVGQALAGTRLVEERVRVDAHAHAVARVADVARAARRVEVQHLV